MPNPYDNKPFLYRRYVIQRKTAAEIAKEVGVSEMTINRWLVKYELMRNTRMGRNAR